MTEFTIDQVNVILKMHEETIRFFYIRNLFIRNRHVESSKIKKLLVLKF